MFVFDKVNVGFSVVKLGDKDVENDSFIQKLETTDVRILKLFNDERQKLIRIEAVYINSAEKAIGISCEDE